MGNTVIRVENLGKRYRLGKRVRYHTLRDTLTEFARRPARWWKTRGTRTGRQDDNTLWALRDLSFEVQRGEVLGIIGRNGAGKSTLLKILSRITEPTTGEAELHGRIGSLLEVGTGFHPELTGRENIFLNGAILGMKRREIVQKFDAIVGFAEIEQFIDTPVKHYSSGMYTRLAFAVAAHLEPEILIVDEVLAVGDAAFQKKCLGKMNEVARDGRTVLFVSHNMTAVQSLCGSALLLEHGTLAKQGPAIEVAQDYFRLANADRKRLLGQSRRIGSDLELLELGLHPTAVVSGGMAILTVRFRATMDLVLEELCVLIVSSMDVRVAIIDLRRVGGAYRCRAGRDLQIETEIRSCSLVEGMYKLGLYVRTPTTHGDFPDLAEFEVTPTAGSRPVLPYPAAHRGFLELQHSTPFVTEAGNALLPPT